MDCARGLPAPAPCSPPLLLPPDPREQTAIIRDGDEYVIRGRKWWATGAGDPRCKLIILMGRAVNSAAEAAAAGAGASQSMVLIPFDAPGVRLVVSESARGPSSPRLRLRLPAAAAAAAAGCRLRLRLWLRLLRQRRCSVFGNSVEGVVVPEHAGLSGGGRWVVFSVCRPCCCCCWWCY